MTLPEYTAPPNHACGRHGKHRDRIGDESCFLNARLARLVNVEGLPKWPTAEQLEAACKS